MAETTADTKTKPSTKNDQVRVTYNGRVEKFDRVPTALVSALLAEAVTRFGIVQNQHLMSLFDSDGVELPEQSTLEAAGVKKSELLVLRQSVVKGGQ